MAKVDMGKVWDALTDDECRECRRIAKRFTASADAWALAMWARKQGSTNDQMNLFIRSSAGRDVLPQDETSNGNGEAKGMNDLIRRAAGRAPEKKGKG